MKVFLTGATGYIGSAILPLLVDGGHDVTAIVRSSEKARAVEERGATAVVGDLDDRAALEPLLRASEGVIHTASPGDATSERVDATVADAVIATLAGTGTPYIHTGGAWVWGNNTSLTEEDPKDPPALTAWRVPIADRLAAADLPLTVLHPGIVYGYGKGLPAMVSGGPRTDDGRLITLGSGLQHWTTIHVDDIAALYLAVLEAGSGFGDLLGVSGDNPQVIDVTAAAAGDADVATESADSLRARVGDDLAEALLLDQAADAAKARSIAGWTPTRPTLIEELRNPG